VNDVNPVWLYAMDSKVSFHVTSVAYLDPIIIIDLWGESINQCRSTYLAASS